MDKKSTDSMPITEEKPEEKPLPIGRIGAKVPNNYNPWAVMTDNPWAPRKQRKQEN